MDEWVASNPVSRGHVNFRWHEFHYQNDLVIELLESMFAGETKEVSRHEWAPPPYRILDAYHINLLLRPDQHHHKDDSLHSCAPGKVSVYNRLLLHWLRMDRTVYYQEYSTNISRS